MGRDSQKVETAEAQDDASTSLTEHENFDSLDKVEQLKNVLSMAQALGGNHKLENGQAVHDITLFDPSLLEMAKFHTVMHRCFQSSHGVERIPSHSSSCNFETSTPSDGSIKLKLVISFDSRWNLPKGDNFELFYEE